MNSLSKLKIGITGATGYIGSFVLNALAGQTRLRALARNPHQSSAHDMHQADLNNYIEIGKFSADLDVLIHLANSNLPRDRAQDFAGDISANLVNSVRLFENFASTNRGGHIIFFSSGGAIYDPLLPHCPRKETDALGPISNYGVQKLAAENYLCLIAKRDNCRATVLRVSNPYGVIPTSQKSQGIISMAMRALRLQLPFTLFGSPETVRDYVHLADVVEAIRQSILNPPSVGQVRTINVGTGVGTKTWELLEMIEKVAGRSLLMTYEDSTIKEPAWNVLDIDRAKAELGWEPKLQLLLGLSETWSHDQAL